MKYILLLFVCVFAYRLAVNISALIRLNYYDKAYTMYLSHPEKNFGEYTAAITALFKMAGLKDRQIPFVKPMGYGQLLQGHTLLFSNMANRREDVVSNMIQCFSEAKGTFKHRIAESFSPLFWINCLLFLPRTVLEYLGVSGESLVVKLFQLFYWIVTPFLLVFRENIYQYILSLIG